VPEYAHLPLLHGPDGKKLSKRHGAASVQELRDAGYLPEAVINYLALLGAGFAADEEFFAREELARRFRLERVSRNPSIFDERKLRNFNGRWIRQLSVPELTRRLEEFTGREGLEEAVAISQEKIATLADFWPLAGFIFDGPAEDGDAFAKILGRPDAVANLAAARDVIAEVDPFTVEALEPALGGLIAERATKPKDLYQPIRVALSGRTISPGIFESLAALGRDESLKRIDSALDRASVQSPD
jgi:glutamyl-tRNA synthetase